MSDNATHARYDSVFRDDLFKGQVIIVTGGGSGIGRCIAHELTALGAHAILVGRKREKLDAVAEEIAGDGGSCETASFDIRDEDAVTEAIADMASRHGRIHGLVNNAGGQFPANAEDISKKGWDAVIATNLTGGFLMSGKCSRRPWPNMAAPSSTSPQTCITACRAWPIRARRGRGWRT